MEMHYDRAIIRPIVTQTDRAFTSSVLICDPHGDRQLYEGIGRFASDEAAALFAVNWAIAQVDGKRD
jgi:hypothetical protein